IGLCPAPPPVPGLLQGVTLPSLERPRGSSSTGWRCRLHAALTPLFGFLITIGWLGLASWTIASFARRRLDLAMVGALPLAVIVSHCLLLLYHARFIFTCEALALGVGLPAGASLLRLHAPGAPVRRDAAGRAELVLRVLGGEPVDVVARESQVLESDLREWIRIFLEAGTRELANQGHGVL